MLGARHCPDLDSEMHEHVILGIDVEDASTRAPPDRLLLKGTCPNHAESGCQGDIIVAMALPVTKALKTEMDGDGGMRIRSTENDMHYVFKPVNLQALWLVLNIKKRNRVNFELRTAINLVSTPINPEVSTLVTHTTR